MPELRIKLLGNVAFQNRMKLSEGFLYDVPADSMGIPYIPLAELLPQAVTGSLQMGFAFPEGYPGLVREADRLVKLAPDITPLIRSCFTEKRFYPQEGCWVRYLKSGQVFYATLYEQESAEALKDAIASVTRLGIEKEGISGRVECSVSDEGPRGRQGLPRRSFHGRGQRCDRLEFTLMPLTPMCIYAPCGDGVRTLTYVPGAVLRDALEAGCGAGMKTALRRMTFSNAYISDGRTRLLPTPLCMSLVKLDKTQLHYRLSPGKDPNRVEQDVSLGDAYAGGFTSFLTVCTSPETERINAGDGGVYDALSSGQLFRGTVYGEDGALRALYGQLLAHPTLAVGHLTREGFGQAAVKAELLPEDRLKAEHPARSFDVSCLSHTLILNRMGMWDTTAEGMLEEIEGRLRAPGRLRIVGRYMDAHTDYSWNSRWGQEGPAVRCLSKGSVMRLETRDGRPVDITPILHGFIGERTKDGYGEIISYPALDGYYRAAETVSPEKYGMELPLDYVSLQRSSHMIDEVLRLLLKRRIQSLAVLDRRDDPARPDAGIPAPLDLLRFIRDGFHPAVSDEALAQWYWEGRKEDAREFFF